jgi:histidinol dehydrogenase
MSKIQATYLKTPPQLNGTAGEAKPSFNVAKIVEDVIADVTSQGDTAVRQYSEKFDKWSPASFRLSKEDIEKTIAEVDPQTVKDIIQVQSNVRKFAEAQLASMKEFEIEIQPGV